MKLLQLLETKSSRPIPGLHPWTMLGTNRPLTNLFPLCSRPLWAGDVTGRGNKKKTTSKKKERQTDRQIDRQKKIGFDVLHRNGKKQT